MLPFISPSCRVHKTEKYDISDFMDSSHVNIDNKTVDSFGSEWGKFHSFSDSDIKIAGDQYFDIITDEMLGTNKIALDLGCGSGRWSKYLSPRIGFIEAIDPSNAVFAAAEMLKDRSNIRISKASANNIPFADGSFDLVFSLGVLHHIPDTLKAMQNAAGKLKKNGFFLVYLYYALDNRGTAFRLLFKLSDLLRKMISGLPYFLKQFICDMIAVFIYLPFVFLAKFVRLFSTGCYKLIPLSYYADKSFYIIRNDALDRFGTPLEQRFTREQIRKMMQESGLSDIVFSKKAPYWHAVGRKV